jgi:4-hydroxybenzoate polyprenyltransferase
MALNDYADRAVERPGRPIPSGRVRPRVALGVAAGLTVAGLGLAGLSGRGRALAVAVPLAGTVWAYDLIVKSTPVGPVALAVGSSAMKDWRVQGTQRPEGVLHGTS